MTDRRYQHGYMEQDFNAWWLSLPEGRRNALIDDKWMLAHASYDAGRAASVRPAKIADRIADIAVRIAKDKGYRIRAAEDLLKIAQQLRGDSVAPTTQPPGATLETGARSQWISVDERLPEIDYSRPSYARSVRCLITTEAGWVAEMDYESNGSAKTESGLPPPYIAPGDDPAHRL